MRSLGKIFCFTISILWAQIKWPLFLLNPYIIVWSEIFALMVVTHCSLIFFLISYLLSTGKLIDHICMDLFLGSLFCSIDLCVSFYANTILFKVLLLCNVVCNIVWYLQLYSSFLKIALALWGLWWFYTSFRIVVLFLWKMPLEFW